MRYLLVLLLLLVTPALGQKVLIVDVDDLGREFLVDNPTPFFTSCDTTAHSYEKFYTCPVCSPSRAAMNYGVRASHPDLQAPWLTDYSHSPYATPTAGPLVTLGQALTAAGLTTAHVGKWHMAPHDQLWHPQACGWQQVRTVHGNVQDYYSYTVNVDGVAWPVSNSYLTTAETAAGLAFINQGVDVVNVSYHSIHDPWHVPPVGTFTAPVDPSSNYDMARAMLENLSRNLTVLTGYALQQGYTVLLFSDNGGKVELNGCKGSPRECGTHTMLWAAGPGIAAHRDQSLVGVYDIYATVLEIMGVPKMPSMAPQSVSLVPTFPGTQLGARVSIFTERYTVNGEAPMDSAWHTAVTGVRYKYRRKFGVDLLIDLQTNPADTVNLLNHLPLGPEAQTAYALLLGELQTWTQ